VIVYAESSAILAWLLGETTQSLVLKELRTADRVVSSSLTSVECARGLSRARAMKRLSATDELAALHLFDAAQKSWDVHDLSDRVTTRARRPFPAEPVRTLGALHLATALVFQEALGTLAVLSLDDRIRDNVKALGIPVIPKSLP
jgi:uncharacterized protein with PIN domain